MINRAKTSNQSKNFLTCHEKSEISEPDKKTQGKKKEMLTEQKISEMG